jgi:hypothetical protein
MTPYPKKADTKRRMSRKQSRRKVFLANRTESKLRREARREARAVVEE